MSKEGSDPLPLKASHTSLAGSHCRKRVEVFGYALSPRDGTPARDLIEAGIEHFHDGSRLSVVQLADLIRTRRFFLFCLQGCLG